MEIGLCFAVVCLAGIGALALQRSPAAMRVVGWGRRASSLLAVLMVCSSAEALQLTVAWDDNATDETGFKIERSTDNLLFVQIATVGAGVTSYVDTSVTARSYWYRVRAYNATTDSAYSNVAAYQFTDVAPTISTQPVSQSVTAGADVSFSVAASGTPVPTYQWKKDGVAITGATAATLSLNGVTTTSAASYTVVVTNSAGTVTSNPASLTVTAAAPTGSAPSFTTQPVAQSATLGTKVTFTVAVTGSPAPTLQWRKDSVAISGATSATLSLDSVTAAQAGTYTVVATNASGSITSSGAALTVSGVAPSITNQPASQTVATGADVAFAITAAGVPAPTYQWRKDGVAISGATSSTLSLKRVTSAGVGAYTVVVSNSVGTVTSKSANLSVASAVTSGDAPVITTQPTGQVVGLGSTFTFSVVATGTPAPTYQWSKDGSPVTGATAASLSLDSITAANVGRYSVVVTNASGSVTSNDAVLSLAPTPAAGSGGTSTPAPVDDVAGAPTTPKSPTTVASRLTNASIRATGGQADETLIIGFVVSEESKSVLVRAVGPSLSRYTSAETFSNPKLTIFDGSKVLALNDNWGGGSDLKNAFVRTGAFELAADSKDAAVLTRLEPKAYTVQVSGSGTGMALAEIYEMEKSGGRLINIAARARVGSGDSVLIAGFVIAGDSPKQVLVRATGPALESYGVSGVLARPQLSLCRGTEVVAKNERWGGTSELVTAFNRTGAFPLSEPKSNDAALLVTLQPGAYSAIVSGVDGSTGVALVEVYEMP